MMFLMVQTMMGSMKYSLYCREDLCRGLPAFGKGYKTLGKGFAEGCLRQKAVGKFPVGKGVFAEGRLSGTRQRFCRGLTPAFGEKKMPLGH
jgi:hypothetical protein